MGIQEMHEGQTILGMISYNIITVLISVWVMAKSVDVTRDVR